MNGTLANGPASPGGTATMTVDSINEKITVKNIFSSAVASGSIVVAGYMQNTNSWAIIAADCDA